MTLLQVQAHRLRDEAQPAEGGGSFNENPPEEVIQALDSPQSKAERDRWSRYVEALTEGGVFAQPHKDPDYKVPKIGSGFAVVYSVAKGAILPNPASGEESSEDDRW